MTSAGSGRPGARAEDPGFAQDPVTLMLELPDGLWGPLLRWVRRAVERVPRSELPTGLRPFAGWTPESLAAPRPRRAVAEALAGAPRLREALAEVLDAAALAAVDRAGARAAEELADAPAVAGLVARGRWDELAVVAAERAQRSASDRRSAAEERLPTTRAAAGGSDTAGDPREGEPARLRADLEQLRSERDADRRRADAAEERARRDTAARDELAAQLERERRRVAELEDALVEERRRRDRRVARLHRRVEAAEARAQVDDRRARGVADDLERLAARLRSALEPPQQPAAEEWREQEEEPREERGNVVPRSVPAALPGRPCRLPPGLSADSQAGVRALLQVGGLEVVADGYNVTMHPRGRPGVGLAEQRLWLVQLAGQVAARFRCRVTLVFDGTDVRAPVRASRGVRVVFTEAPEIADERITLLIEGFGADTPVLVVSNDREVQADAANLSVDVVGVEAFLAAVDA